MLSRKLVNYISVFKLEKHYSRIDIVFVCFFFIVLLLPALQIDNNERSAQENRMLAKYMPLFGNNGLNLQYGKQFESWFNDHFWSRKGLIKLNAKIKKANSIISNGKAIFNTKNNWVFDTRNPHLQGLNNTKIKEAFQGLENLNKFATQNNIKLYVLIVPDKSDIYQKKYPTIKTFKEKVNECAINYFKTNASFPIIFPYEELAKQKEKDFVFFKTEHHWTEWGAYLGYKELIDSIRKDFSDVHIANEDEYSIFYNNKVRGDWGREFTLGQTFNKLNIKYSEKKLLDISYKYYTPKHNIIPKITDIKNYKTKHYVSVNNITKVRAVATGTSMNENLMQFLPYSFKELKYFRLNNVRDVPSSDTFKLLKRYKKDILDFKPNVLILTITAGNIWEIKNLTQD